MRFSDQLPALGCTGPDEGKAHEIRAPKIGYVLKMFPRLSETFILNEVLELERQGVPLHLFSMKRPIDPVVQADVALVQAPITYLPERIYREPFRVLRAQFGIYRHYPHSYRRVLAQLLRGHRLKALGRYLRRFCQACCLLHETGGLHHLHAHFATGPSRVVFLAHQIAGIPYSITTHAKDLYLAGRLTAPGFRKKVSLARFIVTNSQYSAICIRSSVTSKSLPIHTIYNGIDLDTFPQRQEEPTEPLILSVGRLVEKKGFTDLIRACRRLRERGISFRCEIVGSGPLESTLQALIKECGLEAHVRLLGPLSQQALRSHYCRAVAFALPCVVAADGDRDMLPNVLKEAMATGVPLVTTRLGGIEELVEDGASGLLVPPGDTRALAQTLERLLTERSLRQRLATRARQVMEERFDRRLSTTRLSALFLGILGQEQDRKGEWDAPRVEEPVRVGYVLKRFPRLSETFILRELLELEQQGTALQIYSMVDPTVAEPSEVQHGLLRELVTLVTYLPSTLALKRWRLKRGQYSSGSFVEQAFGHLCGSERPENAYLSLQAAFVGHLAQAQGVKHLHAHFGAEAATVAMLASRFTGIPFSFTAHAKDIYHEDVDQNRLREKIYRARFVVTVSDYNRQVLRDLAGAEAAGKIIRLYNGIDLSRCRPDPHIPKESDLLVAAGRLVEKKGFYYLIQACRFLLELGVAFRCLIIGEGPERQRLTAEIERLGLVQHVRLLGALPQEKLLETMQRATLFVLPCVISVTGDRDALPTVLLEALALGVPAISTDLSGIPEIIEQRKTGLLVPPGNWIALAQAIQQLLASPRLRAHLAREGRRKVEEVFDIRKNAQCLRELLTGERDPVEIIEEVADENCLHLVR